MTVQHPFPAAKTTPVSHRHALIRCIERDEWGDPSYAEGWAPSCGAFAWEHDGTNRQLRDRLSAIGFGDDAILAAMGEADRFLLGLYGPPPVMPTPQHERAYRIRDHLPTFIRSLIPRRLR